MFICFTVLFGGANVRAVIPDTGNMKVVLGITGGINKYVWENIQM
jgi:hypothetical protein